MSGDTQHPTLNKNVQTGTFAIPYGAVLDFSIDGGTT